MRQLLINDIYVAISKYSDSFMVVVNQTGAMGSIVSDLCKIVQRQACGRGFIVSCRRGLGLQLGEPGAKYQCYHDIKDL
jgi:hypothetical protein